MSAKQVLINDVRVSSSVGDNQRTGRGTPDLYVLFSSQFGEAGNRRQFQRNNASPTFEGPFTLNLGGPRDVEEFNVEIWDYDGGRQTNDDLIERVIVSLGTESATGSRTWPLSRGGSLTFAWRIQGRPEPAALEPPAGGEVAGSASSLLKISQVTLQDLLARDGRRGVVDPYMILTGLSNQAQERWNTKRDDAQPSWIEDKTLPYDPAGYEVAVWDDDFGRGNGDDLLGNVEVQFPAAGEGAQSASLMLLFRGREYEAGEITFRYVLEGGSSPAEPASPEAPEPPTGPQVVTRREIRKMPAAEQQRFVAALKKCMENQSGPQTSVYARLAGYHGWPTDYCSHGEETFPGWHRGYLVELERELIKADTDLGNDGNIGLPYWDWSDLSMAEVMPKIIRDEFPDLPDGLIDRSDDTSGRLGQRGFSGIRTESALRDRLEGARVGFQAEQCLTVAEHWMHASTRFIRAGYSVESPHSSVHVACGFPMTSVQYAAFHPIFFLHHCNVDRVYEKHVQMETAQECAQEFSSRQSALSRQGEENRYARPLTPFKHPFTQEDLLPRDTFNTSALGYVYDELPPTPPMQLREEPVFAAFLKLEPMTFANKSYMIHVFVMPKDEAAKWEPPAEQDYMKEVSYAGSGAIFGSKGQKCENCTKRKSYNVLVEVQEALKKQGLSRYDAGVRVVVDEDGEIKPLEDTDIGAPMLCGPIFEDTQSSLAVGAASGEVHQLQTFLSVLGYYVNNLDGQFGPKTEEAVKRFQKFVQIQEDGIAGPITKGELLKPRFDLHPDFEKSTKEAAQWVQGSTVLYTIGVLPGYLDKVKTRAEIHKAFEKWGHALQISFAHTGSAVRAALRVDFQDLSPIGEALGGGLARPGGQLAEATRKGIKLDASERWLLRGQAVPENHPRAVPLFPVMLHEIGHVLGLSHSSNPEDVMWPYLRSEPIMEPSQNDIAKARKFVVAPTSEPAARMADGDLRWELGQLRGEIVSMRAEMREMSRIVAASFQNTAAGSGAKAANCCSTSRAGTPASP